MNSHKIRLAIADDHPLVISGLEHILVNNSDMVITGRYNNGAELMAGIAQQQPDVLLLDIQMPDQTGDELAVIISQKYPAIRMLALTNLDNVYYIKTMLEHGVHGYILKTTNQQILLEAIRTVHSGKAYLEPQLEEKLRMDQQSKKQETDAPTLSRREQEVLRYIASELTSQEIADKLYVSKRTIDSHRLNLMAKLDVKNSAALVKKAILLGLIG